MNNNAYTIIIKTKNIDNYIMLIIIDNYIMLIIIDNYIMLIIIDNYIMLIIIGILSCVI